MPKAIVVLVRDQVIDLSIREVKDWDQIRSIVCPDEETNGTLEVVHLEDRWHLYIDEDGKGKRLPPNAFASSICHFMNAIHRSDHIAGNCVFFNSKNPETGQVDGEDYDIDEELKGMVRAFVEALRDTGTAQIFNRSQIKEMESILNQQKTFERN